MHCSCGFFKVSEAKVAASSGVVLKQWRLTFSHSSGVIGNGLDSGLSLLVLTCSVASGPLSFTTLICLWTVNWLVVRAVRWLSLSWVRVSAAFQFGSNHVSSVVVGSELLSRFGVNFEDNWSYLSSALLVFPQRWLTMASLPGFSGKVMCVVPSVSHPFFVHLELRLCSIFCSYRRLFCFCSGYMVVI